MLGYLKGIVRRILRPPLHKANTRVPHIVLGTEYGGWPLPVDLPKGQLLYSFGVGKDISFDLGAIDRFGCRVIVFDPTPRSQGWLASQKLPEVFQFDPTGNAARDGGAEFFCLRLTNTSRFGGVSLWCVQVVLQLRTGAPFV